MTTRQQSIVATYVVPLPLGQWVLSWGRFLTDKLIV
ncbi:unnamed protein product [Tenebrio molitor]|nr:unnamed protein product [Tenebrio molitor]